MSIQSIARRLLVSATLVAGASLAPNALAQTVVFDDFEHGDPVLVGWFAFGSDIGGGGIDPNGADLAPIPDNAVGMQTGWGSGGGPGFWGGFGWGNLTDITGTNTFTMWINPDADQTYTLEINIQDDDDGDGQATLPNDDEFQFNCEISPTGPCAVSGGGWQKIEIPLSDFFDDNSFLTGGDGVLNGTSVANGGNGEVAAMVIAVIGMSDTAVTFRTDQWQFETISDDADSDGVADSADNCINAANADQIDSNGDGFGNACDADFNDDCIINFIDIAAFSAEFLGSNPDFDLNGDGAVNFLDFISVSGNFLGQPGPSATASCDAG